VSYGNSKVLGSQRLKRRRNQGKGKNDRGQGSKTSNESMTRLERSVRLKEEPGELLASRTCRRTIEEVKKKDEGFNRRGCVEVVKSGFWAILFQGGKNWATIEGEGQTRRGGGEVAKTAP